MYILPHIMFVHIVATVRTYVLRTCTILVYVWYMYTLATLTQESPEERSSHSSQVDQEEEIVSFRGQSSHELLHPPTAVYVPQQVRLEREKYVYFTPSRSVTTAMEEKTPSGLPPHYRDDEGLFVGRRPKTKWTNHVTVENRLLHRYDKVLHFTSALCMYVIQSDVWLYRCIIYDSCI